MDIAELGYSIDARSVDRGTEALDRHTAATKRTETATERMERGFSRMSRQVLGFVGAFAGIASVGAIFRGVIANTIRQEQAFAQLEARIRSTGGASGYTARELASMAAELQKVTTFGDEAIMEMQGLLLTFTKVGRETFPRAQRAILDVATAMGTDLKSAALQVGKALNDPVAGISALSRSGIQFTRDQREMINTLTEAGQVAEAQGVILAELEKQFGGAARAARDTFGGSLRALRNTIGDLLEGDLDGNGLRGATKAVNDINDALNDPAVKEGFDTITSAVFQLTREVMGGIAVMATYINKLQEVRKLRGLADSGAWASADEGLLNARLAQIGGRLGDLQGSNTGFGAAWRRAATVDQGFQSFMREQGVQYSREREIEFLLEERTRVIRELSAQYREQALEEEIEADLALIQSIVDEFRRNAATASTDPTATGRSDAVRAARDAERERQQIAEAGLGAADQLNQTLRDQAGVLGGPGVRAANAYVDAMMGLLKVEGDLAAAGMLTADAVRGLSQAREDAGLIYQANLEAIEAERSQAQRIIEDLEFERELLSMTNAEREVAIALRYAAADATQAELDKIRELVIGNRELREAEAERAAGLDVVRRASMGLFDDIIEGGKSAKQIIIDFAKTVLLEFARIQAQKLIMDAMGSPGTSGGGSYGDAIGSALGLIFGGGRYLGGDVRRDRLYQVGERNVPEIANIGGRQFLIPGDRGRVDPMPAAAPAPAPVVNQKIYVSGNASPGTARQIELEAAKRQRIVAGRFGG